jgi:hypothetical protein
MLENERVTSYASSPAEGDLLFVLEERGNPYCIE